MENQPKCHTWVIPSYCLPNSHAYTIPIHCCINWLSWLVYFTRTGFAYHVKSQLRKWDLCRALDGRYRFNIHCCVSETSLRPSRLVWAYDQHFLDSYLIQTVLEGITHLWLPTYPHYPPHPLPPTCLPPYMCNLWYYSSCDKVVQNPAVLTIATIDTVKGGRFARLNFHSFHDSQEYHKSFSVNIYCKLLIMALFDCFKRKAPQKFSDEKLYWVESAKV